MKYRLNWILVLVAFTFSHPAEAFDDLRPEWKLDFLFHYARMERATTSTNVNFLSRSGGMIQWEYTDPFDLFWRYYFGGDLTFGLFEAPGSVQISPREITPWQVYGGIAAQFGSFKNLEVFLGIGGANTYLNTLTGFETYTLDQETALRAHLGLSYRFISTVGSTAKVIAKYSLPATTLNHNGDNIRFSGVLDGALRLKWDYKSKWSLYGGIRFGDYATESESISYFSTRIYVGIGIEI